MDSTFHPTLIEAVSLPMDFILRVVQMMARFLCKSANSKVMNLDNKRQTFL